MDRSCNSANVLLRAESHSGSMHYFLQLSNPAWAASAFLALRINREKKQSSFFHSNPILEDKARMNSLLIFPLEDF